MAKICGIYRIANKQTGDLYIGSSISVYDRWKRHKKDLTELRHHSIILQRAYNEYGFESFDFELVEECSKESLIDRENYYLESCKPIYNICPRASSLIGKRVPEEQKQRAREYALANNVRPPRSTYEHRMKAVYMLDKESEEVLMEFESIGRALDYLSKELYFTSSISQVCTGKRKSMFGYRWRFKN